MEIFKGKASNIDEYKKEIKRFLNEGKPSYPCDKQAEEKLQLFYRGHADAEHYQKEPTIFRDNFIQFEDKIYFDTIEKMPYEFMYYEKDFDKIAKLQHFGSKTRIMDFSTDALVALYFACWKHCDQNGEVIIYRATAVDQDNIGVKALSIFAQNKYNIDNSLYSFLRQKLGKNYSNEYLNNLLCRDYFITPDISNERLYRQKGVFLMFGQPLDVYTDMLPSHKTTHKLDNKLGRGPEYPGYIGYIEIPMYDKKGIIDELKELENQAITKDYLFPDIEDEITEVLTQYKK